jgi:peroxiredoxin
MNRILVSSAFVVALLASLPLIAQRAVLSYTDQEKVISEQLHSLRKMSDGERAELTKRLAFDVRQLPITMGKVRLAQVLQSLSTEGDFGRDTMQEVTNTLASAIQEYERTGKTDQLPYDGVAWMVRYEGMTTTLKGPKYEAAMADFEASDRLRESASLTVTDLHGKTWTLGKLKGKVVLINFWATWCPPCVKEIPDLEALYDEFNERGLVILGVADDDPAKLKKFVVDRGIRYPILPDVGRRVNTTFHIDGIPASLVYDRNGKLIAQTFVVRTRSQLLNLLEQAGLR